MQITAEPLDPLQVQLTIVLSPERVEKALHEAAQRLGRRLRIPGYRPGHVPLAMVVAHVGEEAVREEATERLMRLVVAAAIEAEGLEPAAPTSVEILEADPLTFRAVVSLSPEVDLADYRAMRVESAQATPVGDEDVDAVIDAWRRDLAFLAPVERPAEHGDAMTLALLGRLGDAVVYEQEAANLILSAEGAQAANIPAEAVDHLVGLAVGSEHTFEVTYSEFWPQPELQGREVAFEANVVGVSAITLPELDDALAQEVDGTETLEDLRTRVRAQLAVRAELEVQEALVETALDALVERANVRFPPALLQAETAEVVSDLRSRVERQGFTWERWLELQEKDEDTIWSELEVQAEQRLRRGLVLSEFVKAEGLSVTGDEVAAEVKRLTDLLPRGAASKKKHRDELRRSTASRLATNRALKRLLAIASGEVDGDGHAAAEVAAGEPGEAAAAAETEPDEPSLASEPEPEGLGSDAEPT